MSTWQPYQPAPAERDPRPLSETLDRVTRRLGAPPAGVLSTVFSRWEALVGADIAGHSRPVSLRGGVLVLAVDHPAWAAQLRFLAADLAGRVNDATGAGQVAEVQVRVVGQPVQESPFRKGRRASSDPPLW
jgi:predicted nucleic acid-binding Zn ribbon protein